MVLMASALAISGFQLCIERKRMTKGRGVILEKEGSFSDALEIIRYEKAEGKRLLNEFFLLKEILMLVNCLAYIYFDSFESMFVFYSINTVGVFIFISLCFDIPWDFRILENKNSKNFNYALIRGYQLIGSLGVAINVVQFISEYVILEFLS